MTKTIHATFDGEVFRPETPVDLEVDGHYVLTVERAAPKEGQAQRDDLDDLADFLKSIAVHTGIPDLAAEHDHYLYGTPKRGDEDAD